MTDSFLTLLFFGDLNDFLPVSKKQTPFQCSFFGTPTVKDILESLGVPHTEIDLILVNGKSVGFGFKPKKDDYVTVYPAFTTFEDESFIHLKPPFPALAQFIVDANLGKLARLLRMVGFDTLYDVSFSDGEIISIALKENRIVLTRDIGILKNKKVIHGYFLRNTDPKKQIQEVLTRLCLKEKILPLTRCLECNTLIIKVAKEEIESKLGANTIKAFEKFLLCPLCQKIYWEGSHFENMKKLIKELISQ